MRYIRTNNLQSARELPILNNGPVDVSGTSQISQVWKTKCLAKVHMHTVQAKWKLMHEQIDGIFQPPT
jgi:hypothetical protein